MAEGEADNAVLLAAAAGGDQRAWSSLVDRYASLVWTVARSFRLSSADASDVTQATWLRLVEQLSRIRDPERLGAWLATTAKREALAVLRRGWRDVPAGDPQLLERHEATGEPVEADLLRTERDADLWRAFGGLSMQCRQLLRILLADPPPSYAEVGAALDMPIGSIGPTRARCLDALRRKVSG